MLAKVEGVRDLTMTTNGYLLPKHAGALKQAGLRRATVSLDTLDDAVFRKMNGRNFGVDSVLAGIEAAEAADLTPVKINSVVQRGVNDHTVVELARHFKGSGHILRFIEFMDVGTLNGWEMSAVVPSAEIVAMIDAEMPLEPVPPSYPGEVASRYRYADGSGEIGVISSVTAPFCGDCTRLRLSPEGELYTCLFGSKGTDLRTPLRDGATDDDLDQIVRQVWVGRADRYSEDRTALTKPRSDKVEMYHIGG
jgi:cyclic pyranopterin phosphate synthase